MNTTRTLIQAVGLGSWKTYAGWGDLLALAGAIESTIADPINLAAFAAQAAADLRGTTPDSVKEIDLAYLLEMAEAARPTPGGSTELWGSAMQMVEA